MVMWCGVQECCGVVEVVGSDGVEVVWCCWCRIAEWWCGVVMVVVWCGYGGGGGDGGGGVVEVVWIAGVVLCGGSCDDGVEVVGSGGMKEGY